LCHRRGDVVGEKGKFLPFVGNVGGTPWMEKNLIVEGGDFVLSAI
jgi:hypothetical protein